jgi:hypothetical protein
MAAARSRRIGTDSTLRPEFLTTTPLLPEFPFEFQKTEEAETLDTFTTYQLSPMMSLRVRGAKGFQLHLQSSQFL